MLVELWLKVAEALMVVSTVVMGWVVLELLFQKCISFIYTKKIILPSLYYIIDRILPGEDKSFGENDVNGSDLLMYISIIFVALYGTSLLWPIAVPVIFIVGILYLLRFIVRISVKLGMGTSCAEESGKKNDD